MQNLLYLCTANLRRGISAHHRRGEQTYNRRLLRSVLTVRNLANFKNNQDLATVDVLRDIDYPSCAYWYAFCIYKCAHAYLNYVAREYILYSAWASRCCSIEKGNAKASKRGTTTVEIHVFCIPICVMQKEYKQLIINL